MKYKKKKKKRLKKKIEKEIGNQCKHNEIKF